MFMEEVMERTLGRVPSIREVIERAQGKREHGY